MGRTCKIVTAVSAGVIFVALGTAAIFVFQNVLHSQVQEQMPLAEGSLSYDNWIKPPADVYLQFWVFDLLNPYEVMNEGAKPVVEEKGPYSYREIRTKQNITFHDNSTVEYRQPRTLIFDEKTSGNNRESDNFTTLNMPLQGIATLSKNLRLDSKLKNLVELALQLLFDEYSESMFTEYSVKDIIWGYHDDLLAEINKIARKFPFLPIPKEFGDKFGLFLNQNGSDDGVYNVYTGKSALQSFNHIDKWNFAHTLPSSYWNDIWSNMINGTDGTMFHPFVQTTDVLEIFASDICRSIPVQYKSMTQLKGIDLYHFEPPVDLFGNYSVNPDNTGFCMPDVEHCLDSGVLNISHCKQGADIIMSQPHMLHAAQQYIDAIDGFHPDVTVHNTEVNVEPISGTVMHADKRLQINIGLERVDNVRGLDKLEKTLIYPILWLNESATVTDEAAKMFKDQFLQLIKIVNAAAFAVIAFGGLILVITAFCGLKMWAEKRMDDDIALLNSSHQNVHNTDEDDEDLILHS